MNAEIVSVRNLSFSYPDGGKGLENISFSVRRGENLGIIGPNGAGKSTLLFHLNGLYKGSGRIEVAGKRVAKPHLREIRAKVGLVFQDPQDQLFMPTVRDDIAFGLLNLDIPREDVEKRIEKVAKALNLEGYENLSSFRLSLGEKKRVALATVLVLEPEILILDEPTAGLDAGQRRALLAFLRGLETTLIVATHDLDLVLELCHRALLIREGKIRAEGVCRELLSDRALLEESNLQMPARLAARVSSN